MKKQNRYKPMQIETEVHDKLVTIKYKKRLKTFTEVIKQLLKNYKETTLNKK